MVDEEEERLEEGGRVEAVTVAAEKVVVGPHGPRWEKIEGPTYKDSSGFVVI